ncbi:MAG: hypothetical protein PWQ96_1305 [Clostridia bacterium]|nr:hypothetical protein [Clostridiales bacterium]MDK2985663.1 hypothetical protein [Clostridia bacterium]
MKNTSSIYSMTNLEQELPGIKYVPGSSAVHCIHPLAKLAILIFFSITVFTTTNPLAGLILATLLFTAYHFGGLGVSFFSHNNTFSRVNMGSVSRMEAQICPISMAGSPIVDSSKSIPYRRWLLTVQ